MSLPGTVQSAPPGVLGFDSDTVISQSSARQFFKQGYKYCVRYISLGAGEGGDLTAGEANDILNAGLALMAVQHVREPGWIPTGSMGQQDGTNTANNALSIGFPPAVNIWCDLEGVENGTPSQNVIDYCNAWYTAVSAAGYAPGIYVGSDAVLTGQQLYENLLFEHYWQSCSEVPALPVRGYQIVQTLVPQPVNGIGIDQDRTQTDGEGGQAQWLMIST